MTAAVQGDSRRALLPELDAAVEGACRRIAPAWPLDRMIAVNPYWGYVDRPMRVAAAELSALAGTPLLMPRAWYRAQWRAGRFGERHVRSALTMTGSTQSVASVLAELEQDRPAPAVGPLVTDLANEGRDLAHQMAWGEFATRHLSQTCAAFFDAGQARWMPEPRDGLFPLWCTLAERDRSPRLLMGLRGFRGVVAGLPRDPSMVIGEALDELEVPEASREAYLTALLMTVNGWASSCAFRRWEARLAGRDDDALVHLLAARVAWELVLYRLAAPASMPSRWAHARPAWGDVPRSHAGEADWVAQRAVELSYQESLSGGLSGARRPSATAPAVQSVFCIDVRSEVFRRALEGAAPSMQTLGFAGFFGLPIAYRPPAGPDRPQLPGLLAPSLVVRDAGENRQAVLRLESSLERAAAMKSLATWANSMFSFVEVAGLGYVAPLLRDAFWPGRPAGDVVRAGRDGRDGGGVRPEIAVGSDGTAFEGDARVALAAGVLRGMSLTRGFARLVAMIGHGAGTTNNPQAAGLHCGACGGQTGEVNARALAMLLNDPEVRAGLRAQGIDLPASTHVVGGLHNTTTDDVTLYDLDLVPDSHRPDLEVFERRLGEAGQRARAERAAALGLGDVTGEALDAAIRRRASDWSEVRPEWGLARNAAFVVAPRERTRGLDLAGRSFLHEYRWEQDAGFGVLEQIMTAPMVVTHWINMQYYASTVDHMRYGSGDKVLHNVVGGRLGVFEGAGGDLRTGLALQSVHDGRDWVHEPLRLSVYIEAPPDAIDGVLERHVLVRHLVEHEWLFLHRIDPADGAVYQRRADGWHRARAALWGSGPGENLGNAPHRFRIDSPGGTQ